MVIIRKGTGKELERLQEHMERIFDRVFRNVEPSTLHSRHAAWSPNTDVFETESEYEILLEIAGVSRNDVEIIVQNNILAIRGRRKEFLRNRNSWVERSGLVAYSLVHSLGPSTHVL